MATKNAAMTPPHGSRSKNQELAKYPENFNPNFCHQQNAGSNPSFFSNSCSSHSSSSPAVNKSQKPKNPSPLAHSPQNKIRQRKFVVAKKQTKKKEEGGGVAASTVSSCKCKEKKTGNGVNDGNKNKCLCVAYQNLRKSQEEFFKNRNDEEAAENESVLEEEQQQEEELGNGDVGESDSSNQVGNLMVMKRTRERLMEEKKVSVPQSGSGKVMNLVKAFEKLLSMPNSKEGDQEEEDREEPRENNNKVMKWPLPEMKLPSASETGVSGSSFCPPNMILTPENLGLDPRASVSSSWDSSRGRFD